jgi:hypothetical protein
MCLWIDTHRTIVATVILFFGVIVGSRSLRLVGLPRCPGHVFRRGRELLHGLRELLLVHDARLGLRWGSLVRG